LVLSWIKKLGEESPEKLARRLTPIVERVGALEADLESLTNSELRRKTQEFRDRYEVGESLDDLLPEAFAAVREATVRTIGDRQFDVQIMGGYVLHSGHIAEMKTGEGKTYVAPLAAYLNALSGRGVHIITVNDYLARRDREWMGPIFETLGMTVGVIYHDLHSAERRAAYASDITYGTNNEFGFDYLRDNMVHDLADRVQRPLHFAIIDEVDNILIDEARTPLIISGEAEASADLYRTFAQLVTRFKPEIDFTVDLKQRSVSLTDTGINKVESRLKIENIYAEGHYQLLHYLQQALRAHALYSRAKDYVLFHDGRIIDHRDSRAQVVIVDEFTGRMMQGRRYGEGLHQAIEAKEGVHIERETRTLATITYQNFFRLYAKLSGMTGTAKTEEEELRKIYGLDVDVVPTHRAMIRRDNSDFIYQNKEAKYRAVVAEIGRANKLGRPVLVGTTSIESSEHLSSLLHRSRTDHKVLNAKYHEQEAEIVALAGQAGSVTIATNMAGRGTDIKLGEGVVGSGGLYVMGTERHESRRIDNQLRGRSGRQGDPGDSRFFISLEDELMRRFRSDRIAGIMDRLGMDDDVPIENKIVSRSIESAQTRVEGYNFDIRKHVVEFDDVINRQRSVVYEQREQYLRDDDFTGVLLDMLDLQVMVIVETYSLSEISQPDELTAGLRAFSELLAGQVSVTTEDLLEKNESHIVETLKSAAHTCFNECLQRIEQMNRPRVMRWLLLQVIDYLWVEHLTAVEELRQGIGLVAYGQQDPLVAFRRNGYQLFTQMQDTLKHDVVSRFFRLEAHSVIADETVLTTGSSKDVSGNTKVSVDSQKKAPRLNRAARRAQERRERKRRR
jgi:preprotein translocase subunit SecA